MEGYWNSGKFCTEASARALVFQRKGPYLSGISNLEKPGASIEDCGYSCQLVLISKPESLPMGGSAMILINTRR